MIIFHPRSSLGVSVCVLSGSRCGAGKRGKQREQKLSICMEERTKSLSLLRRFLLNALKLHNLSPSLYLFLTLTKSSLGFVAPVCLASPFVQLGVGTPPGDGLVRESRNPPPVPLVLVLLDWEKCENGRKSAKRVNPRKQECKASELWVEFTGIRRRGQLSE